MQGVSWSIENKCLVLNKILPHFKNTRKEIQVNAPAFIQGNAVKE